MRGEGRRGDERGGQGRAGEGREKEKHLPLNHIDTIFPSLVFLCQYSMSHMFELVEKWYKMVCYLILESVIPCTRWLFFGFSSLCC